jgi:chromosome partitioning protein
MKAKVIGFVNQKGGVGKSFASKFFANAITGQKFGKRVLLIDCDEQRTVADMRKRDILALQSEGKDPEFAYDVAHCFPEKLTDVIAGKGSVQIMLPEAQKTTPVDFERYDYIIVDMPGRGQGDDIYALVANLDCAVIVTQGGDSETLSTIGFFKTITKSQQARREYGMDPLKVALMYNEFENTATYKEAVMFLEQAKPKYNIHKEILYLSSRETYRKYDNTYSNILYELRCNKSLSKLYEEAERFVKSVLNFIQ